MKKYLILYISLFFFVFFGGATFASSEKINREEAFIFFAEGVWKDIPESYKYINLNYTGVTAGSKLETALKKLVYLDLIQNSSVKIWGSKILSTDEFIALSNKILGIKIQKKENTTTTISINDLIEVKKVYQKKISSEATPSVKDGTNSAWLSDKEKIFFDVKKTLETSHYERDTFKNDQLIDAAISWLTNGVEDTYTTYFPPTDSKNFFTNLDWEYEWIWAYVEMPNPGELIIVSPISWSPAESAGLKWWDRITHVWEREVRSENSLNEVITWIKGPADSKVQLTVKRKGVSKDLIITVTRKKIFLKDIEYKKLDTQTAYIQIKTFWDNVAKDFVASLEEIKSDKQVKKIIFDLRNNPGGYLDQVANMLSYFVVSGEPTAIVSYGNKDVPYLSSWKNIINLWDYEVVFLQNSGTASASEILIGTLKDYYPESTIIWEQSFGKWSVQSLKNYKDGSTLKYTTAKWYTGKTRQGIDAVGINPDINIEFDKEKFDTYKIDTQLESAIEQ